MAYQFDPKTVVRLGYGRALTSEFWFELRSRRDTKPAGFGESDDHRFQPELSCQQQLQPHLQPYQGAPAFNFGTILGDISPQEPCRCLVPTALRHREFANGPTLADLGCLECHAPTSADPESEHRGGVHREQRHPHDLAQRPSYNPNTPAVGAARTLSYARQLPPAHPEGLHHSYRKQTAVHSFLNGVPAFTYPGYFTPTGAR